MNDRERERFDELVEEAINEMPPGIRKLIDQVPVVVTDGPDAALVQKLIVEGLLEDGEDGSDLCGLHSGIALTHRSVEDPDGWGIADGGEPEQISLFREGIVDLAFSSEEDGGFEGAIACDWSAQDADDRVYEEICITLLHEIGHHFGLDEDDLEQLGYG